MNCAPRTTSRRGFTLIELLAATALSAGLMTVGFQVLRAISRPSAATTPEWTAPLARQVRWDAMQAVAWQATAERVTFAGYLATDPATLEPLHRPAAVTFRVEQIGGLDWLVRDELVLGTRAARTMRPQLLCAGVRAIRFTSLDAPPRATRGARTDADAPVPLARDVSMPPVFRELPAMARMPERGRIVVDFDDANRSPLTIDVGRP